MDDEAKKSLALLAPPAAEVQSGWFSVDEAAEFWGVALPTASGRLVKMEREGRVVSHPVVQDGKRKKYYEAVKPG